MTSGTVGEEDGPASVVVRPVLPAEYEPLGALTVATYSSVLGPLLSDGYRAELADVERRARDAVVLVAVDQAGDLLGSVTYVPGPGSYAEFEGTEEAGLRMLVVSPHAQRRGVGRVLVEACIALARGDGRRRLTLFTAPPMVAAQRFYERLGFRRAPERDWLIDGFTLLGYVLDL